MKIALLILLIIKSRKHPFSFLSEGNLSYNKHARIDLNVPQCLHTSLPHEPAKKDHDARYFQANQ